MIKNILNRPFIEFIDLTVKIYKLRFDNPDLSKAYKLSKKDHFLKAQPMFLEVINFFNDLSTETIKIFNLELEIIHRPFSPEGIKHIIIKNNFNILELFDRILPISTDLLKDFEKFRSFLMCLEDVYLFKDFYFKWILFFVENVDLRQDFYYVTSYQLILVYTHFVDSLEAPINPVLPLFFHLLKEELLFDDKFSPDRFNKIFTSKIREFNNEANKSFTIREFLSYLSEKENKRHIPLFSSKLQTFQLKSHIKDSLSFSHVLRNFLLKQFWNFANNDVEFNIHLLGLKYFILEISGETKIPTDIPDYVILVEQFEEITVLVLVCSVDNSKKIKNNFLRVNQLCESRSLGLYLLKDRFSFNIKKSVGDFPVVEKKFIFHQARNYLQKFKHIPNFYKDYISKWHTPGRMSLGLVFDESIFQKKFDELTSLRTEHVLNKNLDRIFFTNFPLTMPLIKEIRYLIIYIRILGLKQNFTSKQDLLKLVTDYAQIWVDRLILWETNDSILLNCFIPFGWETFIKNIKDLVTKNSETFIFLSKTIELTDSEGLKSRYSSQTSIPPLETFDKEEFMFNIKFPLLSDIKRDFGII
ncbi:MAG: hypothetical protein HeimC3_13760 [Candidatus Heimdallarchaeota archaeon LC_3]|nr:MAG: hypothetical protein HeimC3_13760 [Candidatus Heimdallarchaeota archaeon LC_3]